ncbi:hypothetical protein TWF694_001454 [Orbilia ellipsospora]|uniref:Uncharacterized protein n=1 Tax=Orbilia ellipsospora TaxID=2528407 RepID=A0AAV9XS41_9PEZI
MITAIGVFGMVTRFAQVEYRVRTLQTAVEIPALQLMPPAVPVRLMLARPAVNVVAQLAFLVTPHAAMVELVIALAESGAAAMALKVGALHTTTPAIITVAIRLGVLFALLALLVKRINGVAAPDAAQPPTRIAVVGRRLGIRSFSVRVPNVAGKAVAVTTMIVSTDNVSCLQAINFALEARKGVLPTSGVVMELVEAPARTAIVAAGLLLGISNFSASREPVVGSFAALVTTFARTTNASSDPSQLSLRERSG